MRRLHSSVDRLGGLHGSEELPLAVVASGVAEVCALRIGLYADRYHGEAESASQRDGAVCDAPSHHVAPSIVNKAPGEPELVKPVFDDLVDVALAIDGAQHGPVSTESSPHHVPVRSSTGRISS